MNNLDAVRDWLATGRALLPGTETPTTVHLARALARLCGAPGVGLEARGAEVASAIGESDHYMLVLVDGLGMDLLASLPEGSFLRRHLALEMHSVFPSSTAPGITSLFTGLWPAEHGLPAWFVYLHETGTSAVSLPFIDRFSRQPLEKSGVRPEWLFREQSLLASIRRDSALIMPAALCDSVYTRYIAGGRTVAPRQTLANAVDAALQRVQCATEPSFTYVYHPDVDAAGHDHGPDSVETAAALRTVEAELARLAQELAGRARLVITADHGQFLAPEPMRLLLGAEDELVQMLVCPPTGEGRLPIFHVLPGNQADFREAFEKRYGDDFLLLDREDIKGLRLFGPARLSRLAIDRIGDFVALPAGDAVLEYDPGSAMAGYHGGPSPLEVRIPLILA